MVIATLVASATLVGCEPTTMHGSPTPSGSAGATQAGEVVAASTTHDGVIHVGKTGPYSHTLGVACLSLPARVGPAPVPLPMYRTIPSFQLVGPGGLHTWLDATSGGVWLTAGSWTGTPGYESFSTAPLNLPPSFQPHPCAWSLKLVPSPISN